MKRILRPLLASMLAGILVPTNAAFAQSAQTAQTAQSAVTLSAGYDYSSGNYGAASKTTIRYLPVAAKWEAGRWTLKATVPWLSITGPAGFVAADGRIVSSRQSSVRETSSGVGDVVASAGYAVLDGQSVAPGWMLDAVVKVKIPTADENKGLGTGKTDYSFQLEGARSIGAASIIATVGRRYYGDTTTIDFRDVWYGTIGAAFKLAQATTAGLLYDYRQRSTASGFQQREVTAYVAQRLVDPWRLQFYVVRGLSDGSPDWGVGANVAARF